MRKNFFYLNPNSNLFSAVIIFFYVIFIFANPKFFHEDYFFLLGDFSFYFDLKNYFYSGINGYYPNANGGEGGYDNIKYTIDILIRFINYFLNEFLFFPLWLINRLLICIPAFILIYSVYSYLYFKTANNIISLIVSIYLSGTIFLLQNVNILIWISTAGVIFFFKYLEKDFEKKKYSNVFYLAFFSVLFFSQLRTVIFLFYLISFYYIYLLLIKKISLKYLLNYSILLALLIILFNIITFANYLIAHETIYVTQENINLKESRILHIQSYNLQNINPFYIFRFLINTNNASNNTMSEFDFFYYFSYFNFVIFFLSIFKIPKDKLKVTLIGYVFLISVSFYGTQIFKHILQNVPGLWTLSSPYHIFLVGAPFIGLVFANGVKNFLWITKKYKKTGIFVICISLFVNNSSINMNYYIRDNFIKKHTEFNKFLPTIFTKNFVEVDKDYFDIVRKIDINKKILHLPIVEGHYFIQDQEDTIRFPLILNFFHKLKIIYKTEYVFQHSKNADLFSDAIYFFNEKKLITALERENVKYIFINKNIFHNKSELDNFYSIGINFLNLKIIIDNKKFTLYEII